MTNPEFQIVHKIPGRLRLKIPRLHGNPLYADTLEGLVETLAGVTAVKINREASSLTVEYDPGMVTETNLEEKLTAIIQSAQDPDAPAAQLLNTPGYEAIALTIYEYAEFEQIQHWQQRQPDWLTEVTGETLLNAEILANQVIPPQLFQQIGDICEASTANWRLDWQNLKSLARVEDYYQLRQVTLEVCDRLAEQVVEQALEQATAQGGITGLFDLPGEITDAGLITVLALQTVHRVGLCYGYAPETQQEKVFAWGIFNVGIAQSWLEQQQVLELLRNLQIELYEQTLAARTLEDVIEDSATGTLKEHLLESTVERAIAEIVGETSASIVPLVGVALGIEADRTMIDEVSLAARRQFQLRWLLENQKIRLRPPGPSTPVESNPVLAVNP